LGTLSPPEPLKATHDIGTFDSGHASLDDWLQRHALANEDKGASRTYVVRQGNRVVAFYCLATGSVMQAGLPGRIRRNMPDPVPVMLLGRLAVDRTCARQGLGKALVRDAILRTLEAANIAGIRAILVHAKDEQVADFYRRNDFLPSPVDPLTLLLPLKDVREALR
jgi:predicted N-acetyltransferase YhbS